MIASEGNWALMVLAPSIFSNAKAAAVKAKDELCRTATEGGLLTEIHYYEDAIDSAVSATSDRLHLTST